MINLGKAKALIFAMAFGMAIAPVRGETQIHPLQAAIEDVAQKFPEVTHVDAAAVEALQKSGGAVIFDVRTPEEYAVSHIDGAVQVDPKIAADAFLAKYADALKGKSAVFYCSVGMRSSRLASRVASGLESAGAKGVSLRGGIFAWANAARPLVNASGPATDVHGYDKSWGKLLDKK